ncbi:shikimate dehydrogenase [Methylocapsa palsarum]|uniref:Shikimate dehydrogenase (NADP(+)) n=1 Tax=Methylocapsa palsarum TaxID=1612308 RepID=A0A1I3VXL5_9HYPH|nr:shikimate dehydrogenase [Methylocapsa palsarum]SFJ98976.1 shikimate dehydrogenase [Methylocapsa palsarum]
MTPTNLAAPKACVIGWPVSHSRSPMIHGFWLDQLKIAGSYEREAVAPQDFPEFAHSLAARGFAGGNVTLPHKEAAFALCSRTTQTARMLQAVNTLWFEDGLLCGDNTDAEGFLGALDQDAPGWADRAENAVVLGAGGAARAILFALLQRGVKQISLANRTKARADDLARHFGPAVESIAYDALPAALKHAGLLVNTTSLGMKGQPPLDVDLAPLPAFAVVCDIVYVPLETDLLAAARKRGLRAVSGLGMLLHQAVPGFERWFGTRPSVSQELRALVEADIRGAV